MTASGAELDAQALVASALEHCVFPLAPADDIAKDGVRMWVKGDGVRVTDAGGRQYLDMMSSHARANSLGYGNAEIADAVAAQRLRRQRDRHLPTGNQAYSDTRTPARSASLMTRTRAGGAHDPNDSAARRWLDIQ